MSFLEVKDILFRQGGFTLSASLDLEKGSIGVLLGPSGCGKTSLLRCLSGLEIPDSGSITIHNRPVDSLPPEGRNFGYVFQDLALFDHLTGRGNLEFGLKLRGWKREDVDLRVEELSSRLRIETLLGRRPQAMSGGERQRLAFARSLAFIPDLLLLDEPLSSLDAPLRKELRAYLGESLRREGVTALHVTHDVEEALELADMLFMMRDGKIQSRGSPRELYSSPRDAWTVSFLGLGSLIPIERLERKASGWSTSTALGRIDLPDAAMASYEKGFIEEKVSLFVPVKAVSITGLGESSFRFAAEVQRTVYAGGTLKVRVLPLFAKGIVPVIDFETDPELRLSQGERLQLGLELGLCRLVHDNTGV